MAKNPKRRKLTKHEKEEICLARKIFKLGVTRKGSSFEIRDKFGNLFEMKQTVKTSFKIETYVTPKVISEWRRKYWIFVEEVDQPWGYEFRFAYFCTPKMMEPKFIEMEKKLSPDVKLYHTVMSHMSDILDKKQFKRLEHLLDTGTATTQKYYVSMKYLGEHSIVIDISDPAKYLKKLVAKYQIKV